MIVKAWGSWELFQSLLSVLRTIGDRHGKSIANIATRWVLDHPFVGAVIIGIDTDYVFSESELIFSFT
jgi:aryl-alcohol dehydrogenase-like predicted oxidoreductase